jgi:long-chain acyl-CoA synthetase
MEFENLSELISKNAKIYPDKPLLFFKDHYYIYSKVDETVTHAAGVLQVNGVKKGDRVAILIENSPDFIFALYAIMKIGAIAVPTNVFLKEREIALNMTDCGAEYLITSNTFAERIKQLPEYVLSLKKIFTFLKAGFDSVVITGAQATLKPVQVTGDDLAIVLYTSGTTGRPKGAMLTHGNFISNAEAFTRRLEYVPEDRMLLVLPMFHATTLTCCINTPILNSCSIVILESILEVSKADFPKLLGKLRPTLVVGVPAFYSTLARMKPEELKKNFHFRLCVCGGAPLPVDTINRFKEVYDCTILEGYGLSEAAPALVVNPVSKQKVGSIGTAIDNVEVRIVDDEDNELQPLMPGELIAKGPNIMKGYWDHPEESAAALKNGWLHTGDVAYADEDGYIFIVDRIKDLILVKGMNVYPREIEELLYKYNGVLSAAVVGIPDGEGSELPIAYIKLDNQAKITITDLKNYLKHNLASFKIPRRFVITDDIPLNASGKVIKKELKERALKDFKGGIK